MLDPSDDERSTFFPIWEDKIFRICCAVAVLVDPLFLYIPVNDKELACFYWQYELIWPFIGLQSAIELFYAMDIFVFWQRVRRRRRDANRTPLLNKSSSIQAAHLSGFDSTSSTIRDESDLIDQVVKDIVTKLSRVSTVDLTGFVGVERRIQQTKSLLSLSPQNDRVLLCGYMGSISIQTPTIDFFVKAKLRRTKVLVVLDDVNDSSQLEFLAGSKVPFGPGSRIIITTRDLQQLRLMKILREEDDHDVEIYKVEELNDDEAQQLFVLNAPKDIFSAPASSEFFRRAVDYAAGIPLALKLWRSQFHRRHRRLWNEMKMSLDEKLKSVYRVSYNVLEKNAREIFLDITCFYKGEYIGFAKNQLDACGLSADCGIEVLVDMSLVTIKDNRLWVHDMIQEMGWEIVREQCPEEPGRRTSAHEAPLATFRRRRQRASTSVDSSSVPDHFPSPVIPGEAAKFQFLAKSTFFEVLGDPAEKLEFRGLVGEGSDRGCCWNSLG
ncbi:hypothetical protein ACLB2K_072157 [Fragaria x ananassa]